MIKEAGFLWPISHGESASLFLAFFASLPAVSFGFSCRVSISSQRDFSRISVGFLWDFSRLFDYPQKRG